jgi:hypothetical protein
VSQVYPDPDFAVEIFMLAATGETVTAHHEQDL